MPDRTPPDAVERGDVVTLKSDPGVRYVVLGHFVSVPTYYLVRHASHGTRHECTVRRCEIATVEKRGATPEILRRDAAGRVPRNGTAHPVERDWRDEDTPAPAVTLDEAEPAAKPAIEWEPDDPAGNFWSRDHRFEVTAVNGLWECHDWQEGDHRAGFALPADAKDWAERQAAALPTLPPPFGLAD